MQHKKEGGCVALACKGFSGLHSPCFHDFPERGEVIFCKITEEFTFFKDVDCAFHSLLIQFCVGGD